MSRRLTRLEHQRALAAKQMASARQHQQQLRQRGLVELAVPTGPATRRIESYPLGDYLYDRAKADSDLAKAKAAWFRYKLNLPDDLREVVEKVERLFRRRPESPSELA